jgi:hypothetical protein
LELAARLDAHKTGRAFLNNDVGNAELPDDPRVGHEMARRLGEGENGRAASDRERQQQLIGEMRLYGSSRGLMGEKGFDRLIGNGFGRLPAPAIR